MRLPKSSIQDEDNRSGVARLLRFIGRHVEKFVAAAVVVAAVVFASQTGNIQHLSWQADDLEEQAENTEKTIKEGKYTATDNENVKIFNYSLHAEQIKEWIPSEPYRHEAEWSPILHPDVSPRGSVNILTVELLRGEAIRRTGLNAPKTLSDQWLRPTLPGMLHTIPVAPIWVNLYGTIPVEKQQDIYNQVFEHVIKINTPEYVYYELEKAEIKPQEAPCWRPVIVYPGYTNSIDPPQHGMDSFPDVSLDRLVPMGQQHGTLWNENLLLFSDFEVESAKSYAYRIRLYVVNPHYNMQESSVQDGVDTTNKLLRSDWSPFAKIAVPDRILVQLRSVTPTDSADFPQQISPLRAVKGTMTLNYFDIEMGRSLPPVEKADLSRGMLCNVPKNEVISHEITAGVENNYPDDGLRSGVCVLDFSGGRKLQKRNTRESQTSPDLAIAGKALLLMPDGTMQVITTEPDVFR
jgi:hypothetical protein